MFQSFDSSSNPSLSAPRLAALRDRLAKAGLDGFLVPRADEHQGEYVPARAARLHWLTGFSGSAGIALVLNKRAVIFVDGRYTLQVRNETDPALFTYDSLIDNPPVKWISKNLKPGTRLGFDPWLHTTGEIDLLNAAAIKADITLVAVEENPVDAIWQDQPAPPLTPVELQPLAFAGELARDKLARLAQAIAVEGATHAVLTDPSSLAWTFNIRGNDVPHTPLALGFAILAANGSHHLFMDRAKFSREIEAYLTQLAQLHQPEAFEAMVGDLAAQGARIALDPVLAAEKLRMIITAHNGTVVAAPDPARIPRATKNSAELDGSRAAHRRDGAAMVHMLCWLDQKKPGEIDEITAVTALENFRRQLGEETQMPLRDVSFATISGSGPNGAIMHYRVSHESNRKIAEGELFLLDSGAQYQDGTTDITRTIPMGQPSEEMRLRYTLVLKGLIAISCLRFPAGTRGADIDAFARLALWRHGLDFAHGTGHGVGSYLAVHEGPQRIAKTGTEKLREGMILSNEPGYYKQGSYGVRLENLIVVDPATPIDGGDIDMHGFETLTLAPFHRSMIVRDQLSPAELEWLNAYHARVLAEIGPMVDGQVLTWLEHACAPL
ncbi:aminopeptidase P family protein [Aquamicrobium segne]|uniref:Aminopeptidase P family protein n=1 Tax=Aquamicrobium segne TaxID=469547 RepID=A0ABW0H110_9HYPH